jgi:ribosomal protein S18 acetylase RimI-like enzyme
MDGKIESIMNQSVSLLDAEISNIEQVLVLIQDFYQHFDYPYTEAEKRLTLEELFKTPAAGCIYLIQKEENIVGYVFLSFYFSIEFGGLTAFIDELFVLPRDRGQGIGSGIIHLVEQKCLALNLKAIHLESERTNERAIALYSKLGFVDHNRRLMTKKLF